MSTPIYDNLVMERFKQELDTLPTANDTPPTRGGNVLVTAIFCTSPVVLAIIAAVIL